MRTIVMWNARVRTYMCPQGVKKGSNEYRTRNGPDTDLIREHYETSMGTEPQNNTQKHPYQLIPKLITQHIMTTLKRFLTLFLVVFLAVNVWGADDDVTLTWSTQGLSNGDVITGTDFAAGSYFTVTCTKGSAGTGPTYYDSGTGVRLYSNKSGTGNIVTVTRTSAGETVSAYITGIEFNGSNKQGTTSFTYSGSPSASTSNTVTYLAASKVTTASGTLRETGGSKAGQYTFTNIKIYYTYTGSGCTNELTISAGSTSHGTFDLDKTGAQKTCSGLVVTVTDITPASGYKFDHIEQTGVTAGNVTIDNAAKTVTYVADVTGASSITAVFTEEASETFDLVTDASDLSVGDEIIILEEDGDVAISTTQNTNNRGETSNFTLSGTTVTVPSSSNVEVFTLGASTHTDDHWTLHASGTEGYLYAANSSNNHLKTRASNDDGNSEWAISISSTIASIIAQGSYTHNVMQYNSGSSIFACYGSANQTDLKIYRKSTTDPTITAPSSITGFTYNYGEGPDTKTMSVSGKNLTGNLTVEVDEGYYEISLNNSTWSTSLTLTESAGTVSSTTVYVRLVSGLSAGAHDGTIIISGGSASSKEVSLTGSVTLICSTPTLSFAGSVSSVNKVLGSGKFTIAASSPDNTLGADIRYSSDNESKATVDINTGEVTLVQATGSGSPVTITATLVAKNTGVACQNEVTTSYTLTIYNKVTWIVNGDEYTTGSPTTQVLQGGQITQLPSNPNGDDVCDGKVFMGWTTSEVIDPVNVAPTPLYKTVSDMSSVYITDNTEYYAVFAFSSGSGATPTLTQMGTGDTFTNGDNIVIVAKDENIAVYQETTSTSYVQTWTFDNNVATVAADDKNWLTVSTATDGWYLGDATNGYIYNSGNNLYCGATQRVWTLIDNSDGSFRLLSSDDRFLSYRNDLATTKWRMGGSSQGTNGVYNLYIYKYTGSSVTYSDYSTVCGTCLPAPSSPVVTPKSNRATITWDAVPDATGYTVTCSGGTVEVDGTAATITGLTANTSYTFTIRSQGDDPYTCFPAYNGSFTTTDCEDSPILEDVSVTTTTATIAWTAEAATATIRIYTNNVCTEQVGPDHTSCTSPYTVTSLTSNTTYYYKVWAGGTCVSAVGTFTTEELKLDIAEWKTDAVVISYNGDADLTLTTFTEETHGDPHANVADDIFFSKYFEAALNVKLLAIFNGTMSNVDLSNYELGLAQAGKGTSVTQAFTFTKFSDFVKADEDGNDAGGLTADELLLKPNEELILITYKNGDDDNIIACAKNDDEHSKFSTYIRVSTPNLQFNGDDVVSLMNPDGDLIDLIGAGTKDGGLDRSGASFESTTAKGTHNGFMDGPGGWYTANGYQANADNTETFPYGLSTNRCLLIRRKFVKSGHAAVALNATDFVTLSAYSYDADDDGTPENYEAEWKGVQIPGSTTEGSKPGLSNSCTGFAVVGGYNYNDYYVDWDQDITPTTFDDFKSDPFDGTYVIPVTDLIDKACTQVRIELKDGADNTVIRKDVKVPIMISGDQNTTDDIFHSNYKDADICRSCDVVVLDGGILTKEADGTTGDINEVRDLKIYQGGKLVIPSGTNYTVNTLAFRRQEDVVATADIQGGLTINENDAVYLDIRIDPTNWHYISLPYDCNVSDITFSTGEPATLGTDYLLKWYDGDKRAATQAGGCWEMVGASSVLKKGLGYIVSLPGNDIVKKELRFPMANDVITDDLTNKMVQGLYGYGCDKSMTEVRANHRGWNLVGNPYFMPYTSDIENPVLNGEIVEDHSSGDPWDGHYKFNDPVNDLRYIVEPVNNGWSEYRQVAIANYEMTPFTCYFVQIGGSDPEALQGIQFNQDQVKGRSSIVRRSPAEYEEEEDTHPVWCAIDLTNSNAETDETTLLISDDFTDGYDIMNDLVKMRGTYYQYTQITTRPVLASRNNEGEMAFNALPDSSAVAGVPLNFFTAYSGSYTIAYNDKFDRDNEVKAVMLLDKTTNQWYDLMSEPYEFITNREDNTTRFILSVRVERKKPQTPTDLIDPSAGADGQTPRKLLINGHVYILRGGVIYDMTGKPMLNL